MKSLLRPVAVTVLATLAGAGVIALDLTPGWRLAAGVAWIVAVGAITVAEIRCRRLEAAIRQSIAHREGELTRTRGQLETKAADAARTLAEREQIFNLAMDMICIAGTDGYFKRVNPAFTRTLGYSDEELVSRPFIDFVHPDDREETLAQLASLAAGRDCVDFENRYCCKDGSYRWLAWRCPAVVGGSDLVYAVARDVTDRKRVETELRKAMAATEAASRARTDFVANMSHEIRTPLNGILGMLELALETKLSPQLRDYLETVNHSAELLLMIVNDVLDFSKMESGKFQLDSTPFALRETLEHTIHALAPRAHAKRLELAFHVAQDVPDSLIGDPVRLRQTVANLVGNAIKFTDRGEVLLDVKIEPEPEHGNGQSFAAAPTTDGVRLHFLVRDTGIGVPADKQQKIFEAFSQADMSTTRKYGGTGLGLTISSYLVEQMGGRLWLYSREGEGSEFHFTACFGRQPENAPGTPTLCRFPGVPVLAVDDNRTNLRILDEMLRTLEMRPTLAANGREALQAYDAAQRRGEPFALAVLDYHMPEMDGYDLAQRLLSCGRQAPAVIVLTSSDRPRDYERFEQLGVAAHLSKPIRHQRLSEAIQVALEGRPAIPPAPTGESTEPALTVSPQSLRVLAAEDSEVNQKLVLELLARAGCHVVLAQTGQEAVRLWEAQAFDLILMDVQMPELDGLEATRQIRTRERALGRHTPIIAMTAHAMQGDRERCLAAGMDDYLSKPIRPRELFAKMAEWSASIGEVESGTPLELGVARECPVNDTVRWGQAVADVGGDQELLCELAGVLLDEAPRLLAKVRQAVADQDADDLRLAAHTLKGSIRPFSALRAFEYAYRLERMGRDKQLDGALEALADLEQEMGEVIRAIRHQVESAASPNAPVRS